MTQGQDKIIKKMYLIFFNVCFIIYLIVTIIVIIELWDIKYNYGINLSGDFFLSF